MSIRVLASRLDPNALKNIQSTQYSELICIQGVVEAGEESLGKASIGNHGSFLCNFMTGTFTTLAMKNQSIIDDGVCRLTGRFEDQTGQRKLSNDYIPLDCFLSPGRVKSPDAINNSSSAIDGQVFISGDSSPLFFPTEFEYLFPNNTEILFWVKNTSDAANRYTILLHGVRIRERQINRETLN